MIDLTGIDNDDNDDDDVDDDRLQELWLLEHQSKQIIRISASHVSKLTGLHHWQNAIELVEKYLYQDLSQLFYSDVAALERAGYDVSSLIISEREQTQMFLERLPATERVQIDAVMKTTATTSMGAASMTADVKAILGDIDKKRKERDKPEKAEPESTTKIPKFDKEEVPAVPPTLLPTPLPPPIVPLLESERLLLLQALCGSIRQDFGTLAEDAALDAYERKFGVAVVERNENTIYMPVYTSGSAISFCHDGGENSVVVLPKRYQRYRTEQEIRIVAEREENERLAAGMEGDGTAIDMVGGDADGQGHPFVPSSTLPPPSFYITGRCDGIVYADQPALPSSSSALSSRGGVIDVSGSRRVAIEMKNRTYTSRGNVPPVWDLVQLVCYLHMYRCHRGELVESVVVEVEEPVLVVETKSDDKPSGPAFSLPEMSPSQEDAVYGEMERQALNAVNEIKSEKENTDVNQQGCTGPAPSTAAVPCNKSQEVPPLNVVEPVPEPEAPATTKIVTHHHLSTFSVPFHGLASDGVDHVAEFHTHVLPRLAKFVAFIELLRRQDSLRILWLQADDEEKQAIAAKHLDFL